ncbi:MAG TPA: MFS transporter [Caulobacteraceae bacterium]|jgi:MFS family permease|nr:MFS transporter [Caulobacteraceae bacterium]
MKAGAGAWATLLILCFVYILNFIDRQLLSILAKPIQDALHVSDGQLGRIGGLYFAMFYCVIAVPVGWLADRTNRTRVLAFACALWSAATIACGLSRTYTELVGARMTVGVGEAGGVPPSYAIITDSFPPGQRGTALGFYNLGPPVGQALGIAFGASIAAAYSWRNAFVAVGIVGIATALIVFIFVREPKKGALDQIVETASPKDGFWSTAKMFFTSPTLMMMSLACAANQFITYGSVNFTTLFLMREKGMTLHEVAIWYALLTGIFMSGGIFVAGWLTDVFGKKSKRAFAIIPAIGLVIAAPLFAGFVHAPTWQAAMLFLAGPTFFNYFYLSPAVAFVQQEVRPEQRVLSGAFLLLIMNGIGLGFGPTFVGAASDYIKQTYDAHHSLQYALYALLPFYVLSVILFLWLAAILNRRAKNQGVAA